MIKPVVGVTFGTDPELFLERDGQIIGSEKVIPAAGLKGRALKAVVVQDGVQVELNPSAHQSVSMLGREVSIAFEILARHLRRYPGVRPNWQRFVDVSHAELNSLCEKNRVLGCEPSKNYYEDRPILVEGKSYLKRGTGGHMHFGLAGLPLYEDREHLVPFLDIFVGNTCVLLDRDPGMAERRENYGRVGEYRDENKPNADGTPGPPHHGLEYRTPSSFWLRSYSLMSFVYGLAGIALSVFADKGGEAERDLVALFDEDARVNDIKVAVDSNNFDLALANFNRLRPWFRKHLPAKGFQLNPDNVAKFGMFASWVKIDGLETFFRQDPMMNWIGGNQVEFGDFLAGIK